ncbi:MAG: hypothetical protein UR93_C0008G0018 [Berkelbacteria bacterium GW2011_GWA2_35_9]|uniref:PHP domain protein n=1 Tax=Berkelbacteria bacterium GW2011_GWA2_35_9 TaxID=1618333 RepID=A0A0G0D3L9_9BACT|nr:MAG: hypothetical protein UR93_C0008G0018 [Berkelbacteria bacterium GW2011_GWA2_35_9]
MTQPINNQVYGKFLLFVIILISRAQGDFVKGIYHIHDNYSDSLISTQDLAIKCNKIGCIFIVVCNHNDCRTTDHSKTYILPEWADYFPGVNNTVHPHKFVSSEAEEVNYVREIIDQYQKISQEVGILIIPGEEITAGKDASNCLLHILSPFYGFNDSYNFTSFQKYSDIESILKNLKDNQRIASLAHPFLDNTQAISDDQWHQLNHIGVLHQLNIKNFGNILEKYLAENNYRLEKNLPLLGVTGDNDYHKTPVEVKYLENLNSRFTYVWLKDDEEITEKNILTAIKNGQTYASIGNLTLENINYIPGVATTKTDNQLKFSVKSVKPSVPGLALNYNLAVYCNGNKIFGSEVNNALQIKNNFLVPFNIDILCEEEKMYFVIQAFYPDYLLDKTKIQFTQLVTSPIIINPVPLEEKKYFCDFQGDVFQEKIKMDIAVKSVLLKKFNGEKYSYKWLVISRPNEIETCSSMIDQGENFSLIIANINRLYYVKTYTQDNQLFGNIYAYYPIESPSIVQLTETNNCIDILDWNFKNNSMTILTNKIEKGKYKIFDFSLDFDRKITNVRYLSEQTVKRYQKRNTGYKLDYFNFEKMILHGQKVSVADDFMTQNVGINSINDVAIYNSTEFNSLRQHEFVYVRDLMKFSNDNWSTPIKYNPNEKIYFIVNLNNLRPNHTFYLIFQGCGKSYRFILDWNKIKSYLPFYNESAIFLLSIPDGEKLPFGEYKLTLMQFKSSSRKYDYILEYNRIILK